MSALGRFSLSCDEDNKMPTTEEDDDVDPAPSAGGIRIEQFVRNVVDFSSQYGSDSSISFTAHNITGRPSKFPNYGDFPETFAMRSYGPWSQRAPSHRPAIMPQTVAPLDAQDYITLEFEEYVWPTRLSIFETYNPGAVCQVWALNLLRWQLLWQHDAAVPPLLAPGERHRARVFSPPLAAAHSPTRCVRLHFNHRHLEYYAGLDGVLLVGQRVADSGALRRRHEQSRRQGRIQRSLDAVAFHAVPSGDAERAHALIEEFLCNGLERFAVRDAGGISSGIQMLPHELLLHIAGYLDLISLCRLAETCRQLRNVACDPILYTSVNCQPYWAHPPAGFLRTLQTRCRLIRQLDLSWSCAPFAGIQSPDIARFVAHRGATLTHLRLNSCAELTADCVATVASHCTQLAELALRNFRGGHLVSGAMLAPLRRLERLDLYHTEFATDVIVEVVARNAQLRHLNVGHGSTQTQMDAVAVQLGRTNRQLVSLDMWKSYGLSAVGLAALAACGELQELDIGWCLRDEAALGDSLQTVLVGCGATLRRLGLASIRGLVADDLDAIVRWCGRIEQLELMGIRGVSADKCLVILQRCGGLEMLDLSFCDSIDATHVAMFRERYPKVAIMWSYVSGDDGREN